jgi:putative aldouronate transport system substrate-binding protein
MEKKLRWLSVMLLLVMIFTTACSGTTGKDDPKTSPTDPTETPSDLPGDTERELYTIQYFHSAATVLSKWSDTPVGKEFLEKFNIDIEFLPPPSGDTKEQLGLMLTAGNYPEIVYLQDQDITNKYIEAGALIALDPYLDKMPNFIKWFEKSIPYWRQAAGDGNLYNWNALLPQDQATFPENNDMLVRVDLLEQQGWKMPVSADEWVEFLIKAKELNPTNPDGEESIGIIAPFGESWGMAGIAPIMYEKGVGIQIANGSIFWDAEKEEYVDMFTHPDTKESFQFFNKLYLAGLLDEETFTDKNDQFLDKLRSGRAFTAWYAIWNADEANNAFKEKGWDNMAYITAPVQSNGQVARGEKNLIMTQLTRPFDTIAITTNAKYPERILEVVDFAATDEGQVLLQSGIEGIHYTRVDGKRVATDEYIDGILNDPDYGIKEGIGLISIFGLAANTSPVDNQPYALYRTEYVLAKSRLPRVNEAYAKLGWDSPLSWWEENAEWITIGLASGVGLEQASDEGTLEARLADFRVRNSAALIMAESEEAFESLYESLVEEYKKLNPQIVVDKYNEIYQTAKDELAQYEN